MSATKPRYKYTKVRQIGRGSYGVVNLVRRYEQRPGGEAGKSVLLVMKVVRNAGSDRKQHQAAAQEVDVLSQLRHPNIVRFHASFLSNDGVHLCIVMDFCESGDLAAVISTARAQERAAAGVSSGHFSEDRVLNWFVQLVLALDYLHQRRILHRDIKPQNVFLTRRARLIKLGDFGITKTLENTSAQAITTIGTPLYFSPEICDNKQYGTKSDVWSLGAMLYELLALSVPFPAKNLLELRRLIMFTKPTPPPKRYSKELCSLLVKLLSKRPDRRPSCSRILEQGFIRRRLGQFAEETREWARRHAHGGGGGGRGHAGDLRGETGQELVRQRERGQGAGQLGRHGGGVVGRGREDHQGRSRSEARRAEAMPPRPRGASPAAASEAKSPLSSVSPLGAKGAKAAGSVLSSPLPSRSPHVGSAAEAKHATGDDGRGDRCDTSDVDERAEAQAQDDDEATAAASVARLARTELAEANARVEAGGADGAHSATEDDEDEPDAADDDEEYADDEFDAEEGDGAHSGRGSDKARAQSRGAGRRAGAEAALEDAVTVEAAMTPEPCIVRGIDNEATKLQAENIALRRMVARLHEKIALLERENARLRALA